MKILTLILITVFMISCGDSPTEPSSGSEDYFPLKVGNKWYYNSDFSDSTSIDITWEVTGEEKIDHKTYSIIIEQNIQHNYTDTLYFRLNGATLFSKRINYDDYIVADFSLNLNDTAYWINDLTVVQKTNEIIEFATPFMADYGHSTTYKKGIGITQSVDNGLVYYRRTLINAEIK